MFTKTIATFALIASLATAASITMPTSQAQAAGGRNAAFAAGAITGLAVGAIAYHGHRHYGHGYYRPHHRPYRPRPAYYRGRPAPWTGAWYDYCSARYRSFNPRTGYFMGYDGRRHFCR